MNTFITSTQVVVRQHLELGDLENVCLHVTWQRARDLLIARVTPWLGSACRMHARSVALERSWFTHAIAM
jgi:hypothetical protein